MKKLFCFLTLTVCAVCWQATFAQEREGRPVRGERGVREGENGQRPARPAFFTEDGRIDLSKLSDNMPAEQVEAFKKADTNKDGFVNQEERQAANLFQGMRGGEGGARPDGQRGPGGFGGPGGPGGQGGPGGMNNPMMNVIRQLQGARTEDGKFDLAKLPNDMDETIKKQLVDADKDKDGFLSREEMGPLFFAMQLKGSSLAEAATDDGRVDLAKLPKKMDATLLKQLKKADKNKDGFLTQEEIQSDNLEIPGLRMMPRNPLAVMFGEALMQDGRVDLAKLPKTMDRNMVRNLKNADADKDGFLNREEMRVALPDMPQQGNFRRGQEGGPGQGPGQGGQGRGPGQGSPGQGRGQGGPLQEARTEDGRLDLSKLPQSVDSNMRQSMKAADLNKDGFLDASEQRAIFPNR